MDLETDFFLSPPFLPPAPLVTFADSISEIWVGMESEGKLRRFLCLGALRFEFGK